MTEHKRKRAEGPFICPFSNCGKVFSRSDHLSRHKANHSSNRLSCKWPGCGRTFTRLDVKKKHESRHLKKLSTIASKEATINTNNIIAEDELDEMIFDDKRGSLSVGVSPLPVSPFYLTGVKNDISVNHQSHTSINAQKSMNDKTHRQVNSSLAEFSRTELDSITNIDYDKQNFSLKNPLRSFNSLVKNNEGTSHSTVSEIEQSPKLAEGVDLRSDSNDISNSHLDGSVSMQLMQCLLKDPVTLPFNQTINGAFRDYQEDFLGSNTVSMLEEIFALAPEFPSEDCQTEVDDNLLLNMIEYIPALRDHPDFIISKIRWFLEIYWLLYHCQYPILHRPSFSTFDTQPLLLLSMVMIGASFSRKTIQPDGLTLEDPFGLADLIAENLRWLIFASKHAKPPCKSWVIQSLIILETFEITSTSKELHERACIYKDVKIQLLRRNPILGGDPLKAVGSDVTQSSSLWNTWIESESMKRVALMSFNMDTLHAVVFGHPVALFANQIKLSLPCPDDLWDYNNVDGNKAPTVAQSPMFSVALQKLLKKEPIEVGSFGRQIVLAGLINLILQIEQNISQWSNFGWDSIKETWKDNISSAIEFWKTQLPEGNCCLTSSSVYYSGATSPPLPPSLMPEDTRCNFPVYHAAQIYLGITHYDYMVFAGAPKRMNVPILQENFEVVVKRIDKWANSSSGPLSVINSYILLCEMLLSPENSLETVNYFYEPDKDPLIYRPNIVISSILSIWAFAFHLHGPESRFRSPSADFCLEGNFVPAMEDSANYLRRIREQFAKLTGKSFVSLNYMNADDYSSSIKEYCRVLPKISRINNLIGLLRVLQTGYSGCKWEVGREYAKLLGNCIQRSAGAEEIFCTDMYDS